MKVSVIIPLYNKVDRIGQSISSVLSQEEVYEIIVIDDGSTDGSADVVKSFGDPRLRYIWQNNKGPSSARNHGIDEAKGDWILFLDADDELLPGAIRHFICLITSNPDVMIFSANYYFNIKGKRFLFSYFYKEGVLNNNFKSWMLRKLMPSQGSTIYSRRLLLKQKFNETIRRFEDAELYFNLMRNNKWYTSKKPVFVYFRDNSLASRPRDNIKDDFCGCIDFDNKTFWERVALYEFYISACKIYEKDALAMYSDIEITINVKVAYMLCVMYRFFIRVLNKFMSIIF